MQATTRLLVGRRGLLAGIRALSSAATAPSFRTLEFGDRKQPVVIVLQEWWGVNDDITAKAKDLASHGFHAIVPDLYNGKSTIEVEEARHLSSNLDFPRAARDVDALIARLREVQPAKRIGLMGFCMGSRLALTCAIRSTHRVDAVAGFYGIPVALLDEITNMTAPLLYQMGEQDNGKGSSDLEATNKLEAALKAAGKTYELHKYPHVGHGFLNMEPRLHNAREKLQFPHNDPLTAVQAWERLLTFLRAHLKD